MLVLTRKAKQQIRLGDDIIVTVLQVKGNSIRLGIEAPRETRVVRGELEFFTEQPDQVVASSPKTKAAAPKRAPIAAASKESGIQVVGPTKLKIKHEPSTAARFPHTMQRSGTMVSEVRPLKRFMPQTMREVVGNVSV